MTAIMDVCPGLPTEAWQNTPHQRLNAALHRNGISPLNKSRVQHYQRRVVTMEYAILITLAIIEFVGAAALGGPLMLLASGKMRYVLLAAVAVIVIALVETVRMLLQGRHWVRTSLAHYRARRLYRVPWRVERMITALQKSLPDATFVVHHTACDPVFEIRLKDASEPVIGGASEYFAACRLPVRRARLVDLT